MLFFTWFNEDPSFPLSTGKIESFTQTIELRTIMTTQYLKQPTLTISSSLAFNVVPGGDGKGKTVSADSITVRYDFQDLYVATKPQHISVDPYVGFILNQHLELGASSLGDSYLLNPSGILSDAVAG